MLQCIDWVQNYPVASKVSIAVDVSKNVFEVANVCYSILIECKITLLQINLLLL
jgi:hypothetical protein